uniref:NADH-ubiquinone oxidoreductase chain 4 n=1 Tax=Conaspidia wangi TaxID=2675281 RepID=A0A8E5BVN0_9HYME|nr:NADH dehydrogenase subunit 4 [Conaspidia wangi]QSZ78258.1 NADH dehydrogenase subunit 4 [Conaspidia wangi]
MMINMLKFIILLLFMMPFSKYNKFWLSQNLLFFSSFLFMFMGIYNNGWSHFSNYLGYDTMSYGLIFLSFWISSLMFLASYMIYGQNNYSNLFIFFILLLMLILFMTFSVMNLFLFYVFFECSLIPILFLIMGWGFQLDRIQAGIYMLFYTLVASLPLLLMIMYMYMYNKTLLFMMFLENNFFIIYNYSYMFMILAFLVKMPMFLVHLWLPKAHVEASISGSMILAGIMLKLGGYGLLRMFNVLLKLGVKFNYIILSVSLIGGILVSMICLFQVDLKSLIAYSSVVHMSMLLGGVMTLFNWGLCGSFLLMISHGLCSSGLFCLVNIIYERLGSRSLLINKGLINFMPSLSLWWFLLCSSNMAAPPSLNLLSEIMLINSMISWSNLIFFLLILLSFFSAMYSLYLYSFTQHGEMNFMLYSFTQGFMREFMILIMHWVPLNFLILNNELFMMWI